MQLFSTNVAHSGSLFLGKFVKHFVYIKIDRKREQIYIDIFYYIVYTTGNFWNILVSSTI